jgi:hypothetical protein
VLFRTGSILSRFLLQLLFLFPVALLMFAGCASHPRTPPAEANPPTPAPVQSTPAQNTAIGAHGYALLSGLMGDEKNVSILRFIKHERPALKTLLMEIAATNRAAYKQLQAFAKADTSLNIKDKGLPVAEVATRDAIADFKQKAILSSKGKDLEIQLLLSQNEALTYGSHLAAVLAETEQNPERRQFLKSLTAGLSRLQRTVITMLQIGYAPPAS